MDSPTFSEDHLTILTTSSFDTTITTSSSSSSSSSTTSNSNSTSSSATTHNYRLTFHDEEEEEDIFFPPPPPPPPLPAPSRSPFILSFLSDDEDDIDDDDHSLHNIPWPNFTISPPATAATSLDSSQSDWAWLYRKSALLVDHSNILGSAHNKNAEAAAGTTLMEKKTTMMMKETSSTDHTSAASAAAVYTADVVVDGYPDVGCGATTTTTTISTATATTVMAGAMARNTHNVNLLLPSISSAAAAESINMANHNNNNNIHHHHRRRHISCDGGRRDVLLEFPAAVGADLPPNQNYGGHSSYHNYNNSASYSYGGGKPFIPVSSSSSSSSSPTNNNMNCNDSKSRSVDHHPFHPNLAATPQQQRNVNVNEGALRSRRASTSLVVGRHPSTTRPSAAATPIIPPVSKTSPSTTCRSDAANASLRDHDLRRSSHNFHNNNYYGTMTISMSSPTSLKQQLRLQNGFGHADANHNHNHNNSTDAYVGSADSVVDAARGGRPPAAAGAVATATSVNGGGVQLRQPSSPSVSMFPSSALAREASDAISPAATSSLRQMTRNSNCKRRSAPAMDAYRKGSSNSSREDVRLDLRGQKVKSLDCSIVNLTAKLEFVYLRENKLSHLAGIEILRRVKVLDLSFNEFKGHGMEALASCKALQQLYLAGNQMTSLVSLPQLPNLEFLSVAQNKLKALAMVSQPKLKVLAASKNKISTFKGFPHFPSLEHLRLEENPLLEMPHVEVASILLVGSTLKKFNTQDITLEEQDIASMYPPLAGLCIRDGWDICDVENAHDSIMQFLVSQWVDRIPPGHVLEDAFVEQPSEGSPCKCHFTFKKDGSSEGQRACLRYQWFVGGRTPSFFVPIEGAVNDVYVPKQSDVGHCLRVECAFLLGSMEYPPMHAVSFPVLPGNGCPKVTRLCISGDFVEGNTIRGHAEVSWCGGTPTRGFVSWLRHDERFSPVMIPGAEDMEYVLSLDDVGSKIILMYTPVTGEGAKGDPHFATTEVIQAAHPSVSNLCILGDMVEGNTVRGAGNYFGGKEGRSKFEWFLEDTNSGGFKRIAEETAELTLTEEDVGLHIMFQYTPVNSEGLLGKPVSIITEKVSHAPPKVIDLRIVGDIHEGSAVSVSATISGSGVEGVSRIRWFKARERDEFLQIRDLEEIGSSRTTEAFNIPVGAIGFYLIAEYTPVLSDGVVGEPAFVFSDSLVTMLSPNLTFLSMMGEFREGETLRIKYNYVGGYEGSSQYFWYLHENENDPGVPLVELEGVLSYQIKKEAINKFVSFKCIPKREDGMVGEEKTIIGRERVKPGSPRLLVLDILGEPLEGSQLQVTKHYWGGSEGHSKIQWFQIRSHGVRKAIEGATNDTYTVCAKDAGSMICVSYEPHRSDGVKGSPVVSEPIGPVLPGLPTCELLELVGDLVEGGNLTYNAVYKGGIKGPCTCIWARKRPDGLEQKLSIRDSIKLTLEDIGCCIKMTYIPVRKDGVRGVPRTVLSGVIHEGDPVGVRLFIPNAYEDVEVIPEKSYFGGLEGNSDFTWLRLPEKIQGPLNVDKAQVIGKSGTYTPTLEDVGSYLAVVWIPIRTDGKKGNLCFACSNEKVYPATPTVHNVNVKEVSSGVFVGDGVYRGGREGASQMRWYRQSADGTMMPIAGAVAKTYRVSNDDYTYSLVFGYTPVREDGVVGRLVLSRSTDRILPGLPSLRRLSLTGEAIEGGVLMVKEVISTDENQQHVWEKYIQNVRYQWSRSSRPDSQNSFELLRNQYGHTYAIRTEDIGFCLRCECVVVDVFGRSSQPVSVVSRIVEPGMPMVEDLEIVGQGYHTSVYTVRGVYSGGREGDSVIQWFRAMAGSPDLIPVSGKGDRTYEGNLDDIGYRLVAVYTPIRDDGVEGTPASASIGPIVVEPSIDKAVRQRLESGTLRFEALLDKHLSTVTEEGKEMVPGRFEGRVVEVNRWRIEVARPGGRPSCAETYSSPFQVEADRQDEHRVRIVSEKNRRKLSLVLQTRQLRDVIALFIKRLMD